MCARESLRSIVSFSSINLLSEQLDSHVNLRISDCTHRKLKGDFKF